MTGIGRCYQNIYIERFWRTLKYEEFYLHECENVKELREAVRDFMAFYDSGRIHQSLGYQTPDEVYYSAFVEKKHETVAA